MSSILPEGSDSKTDHSPEPDWLLLASRATDPYWHELTGMCGGCGRDDCHDGQPCPSAGPGYCLVCPTRRATGEVRG